MADDELIHQIYNAVDEPHTWTEVLANIATAVDSNLIFLAARTGVDQQPFAFIQSGFEQGYFERYQEYFYQVDHWTQALVNYAPNQFHSSHVVVDDRQFLKSEIYNDFAKPANIRHGMGCLMLDQEQGVMAEVGIMRGDNFDVYEDSTRLKANHLIKHVHRSLSISQKMHQLGDKANDFQQLLDTNKAAVFICNDGAVVQELNAAAQALLSAVKLFRITSQKQFCFIDTAAQTTFETFQWQIKNNVAACHDVSLTLQYGTRRYLAKLQLWMHAHMHALGVAKVPAIMVSIRPMRESIYTDPESFMARYQFTRAEAEVAACLCKGQSIADIAILRNKSLATVRQQVKTCMSKAGVHSQAELVSELLSFSMK